jgi:hypothetical protein
MISTTTAFTWSLHPSFDRVIWAEEDPAAEYLRGMSIGSQNREKANLSSRAHPGIHEGNPGIHEGNPGIHEGNPGIHEGNPALHELQWTYVSNSGPLPLFTKYCAYLSNV